jgi:prepilin-type N-terminal cleavage/methylation domain-containing protein
LPRPEWFTLKTIRGFTLIEVLIAAAILVCGLVAVASVFSFIIRVNATNRQTAVATTLLAQKMEEFRDTPFSDSLWIQSSGSETITAGAESYVRTWQIKADTPRTVTVIVYSSRSALSQRRTELIRATTLVAPGF